MQRYISFTLAFLFLTAACAPEASANPRDLVIKEYLLAYGPSVATDQLVFRFTSGDQEKVLAETADYRDYQAQVADFNTPALAPFGYTLKPRHSTENGFTRWQSQLFQGETVLAQDIASMKPVSVSASGTDFIVWLDLETGRSYVLTEQGIEERPGFGGREPFAFVGNQLLSMEAGSITDGRVRVSVYLDDALAYQTEMVPAIAPYGYTDGPWSYQGHWALVLLDGKQDAQGNLEPAERLVVDGQDVNALKGYEKAFQFAVLDERPFFFYQKDGKIGISFDGQEIPRGYEQIPHYECCSGSLENPGISLNMAWFFARRGEDWYYVEAYVPMDEAE